MWTKHCNQSFSQLNQRTFPFFVWGMRDSQTSHQVHSGGSLLCKMDSATQNHHKVDSTPFHHLVTTSFRPVLLHLWSKEADCANIPLTSIDINPFIAFEQEKGFRGKFIFIAIFISLRRYRPNVNWSPTNHCDMSYEIRNIEGSFCAALLENFENIKWDKDFLAYGTRRI